MRAALRAAAPLLVLMSFVLASCASTMDEDRPPSALEVQAARLLEEGRTREALEAFRIAARQDEASLNARVGAALCHARLGDAAAFESAAIEAAAIAPRTILAHGQLGAMYVQAAERFRREPRGRIYAELGVSLLREVFAARPEAPGVLVALGLGFHLKEDHAMAVFLLERAVAEDPGRLDALQALLISLQALGRRARIVELIETHTPAAGRPASWEALLTWARRPAPEDARRKPADQP